MCDICPWLMEIGICLPEGLRLAREKQYVLGLAL